MKSLINKYILIAGLFITALSVSSCEDFLDKQEDEQLTFDQIWETRGNTEKYWWNAMSFIPSEVANFSSADPFIGSSCESTIAYSRGYDTMNSGAWNPSNVPYQKMTHLYRGIRECNIFMQNVDRCSDPAVTADQLAQWKVQARFARAYYYFWMIRLYGPVFLLGDELLDFSATTEELYRPRNTWEECVNYVVSELEACIADPAMGSSWTGDADFGLATRSACQAVIARLKLYVARPLFNGNRLYINITNPVTERFPELSGVNLFPTVYDPNKWKEAADAAKVIIDNGQFSLYRAGNGNPYEDYYGVTQVNWNTEIIWSTGYKSRYALAVSLVPTGVAGLAYGAAGPTQQQVDAYAMNNGRYPITEYSRSGEPIVDSESGYREDEFTKESWIYPAWGGDNAYSINAPVMYKDREPRFYVNVFFSGQNFRHGNSSTLISFAKGANGNRSHDYPKAGYLNTRFYDHTANSGNTQWGNITFPTFRLAEVYLNFIEAVLECKRNSVNIPASYESQAMAVWDDLRDRAGLDPIATVYPGATVDELIELCRHERQVELSFESHRYFDTRTWMIATETDNGPMYGMDTLNNYDPASQTDIPDGYWQRHVFETRVFRNNHYLHPFDQTLLDRNKLLTQNYGW